MTNIDYRQKFDDDFRELFTKPLRENEEFGVELWSALANVDWEHESDPNPEESNCGHSFRGAGSLIASMLGRGEYIDWYCCGPDSVVSEFISTSMAVMGWRYKLYDDPCLPRDFNEIAEEER